MPDDATRSRAATPGAGAGDCPGWGVNGHICRWCDPDTMRHATPDHLRDALDALERMVFQYLPAEPDNPDCRDYCHSFMSAGEYASGVLAEARPRRWRQTPIGLEYIGPMDYEGMYGDGRR